MAFGVDFYLWIGVMVLNGLFMIGMIPRFKKPETQLSGIYFKGVFIFFLIHLICRIPYLIYDYFIEEDLFYQLGVIIGLISLVAFMYFIESTLYTKSKHFFFIYGVITTIASTIATIMGLMGRESIIFSEITQYITLPVLSIVILYIYIYTWKNTVGRVRTNTFIILCGIILCMIGQVAHTPTAIELVGDIIATYVSPVLMMIGLGMFYGGLVRGQK